MQKKFVGVASLAAAAVLALAGCGKNTPTETEIIPGSLEYADNTVLRIAGGYQKTNEAISFQDSSIVGDGLKLADGKTYHTGDLKPTWAFLKDQLKIDFVDKFTGAGSAEKEFKVWENNLGEVDIVAGSASVLTEAGAQGKVIDLSEHLDKMPTFKYYLEQNQIARLSITGAKSNGQTGAIYFSPYFDGVDDIERMPLMRADLVRKLLDDDSFKGANRAITSKVYTPYMPKSGTIEVESLSNDGSKTITIKKDYSKYGNIIDKMNAASSLTGDTALSMFKEYIDKTYGNHYAKRSDLFLGYDAAWDADEMVALFRIAHAELNDADGAAMKPLYSRETNNMQRDIDMFRFAGHLFGVRGMESRSDYLYFGKDGKLHDARGEKAAYEAVERMNALVQEGLMSVDGSATSQNYLEKDAGLMSYDYNQTQTIYNDTIKVGSKTFAESGKEYVAVMVPVAKWNDGTEKYMRFTESWRSVKTDGWAISVEGVKNNPDKLNAALTLIDFAFSIQGQITMSYGPDTFIKTKAGWDSSKVLTKWSEVEDKYETFNFNGQQMPVISDGCKQNLKELAAGNYTNFARRYLGSTLNGFPKSQAFEYQCTSEAGQKGSAVLATAIGAGIIKHPLLAVHTENMWYTSVPTTLPTTQEQTDLLKTYSSLSDNFKSSKGTKNVFYQIIKGGYALSGGDAPIGPTSAQAFADFVNSEWSGTQYLGVKNAQWNALYTYYKTL